LGGKSPAEALREVNPKLPSFQDPEGKEILFLPPIILDDRITLLGGGTEVYRHYKVVSESRHRNRFFKVLRAKTILPIVVAGEVSISSNSMLGIKRSPRGQATSSASP